MRRNPSLLFFPHTLTDCSLRLAASRAFSVTFSLSPHTKPVKFNSEKQENVNKEKSIRIIWSQHRFRAWDWDWALLKMLMKPIPVHCNVAWAAFSVRFIFCRVLCRCCSSVTVCVEMEYWNVAEAKKINSARKHFAFGGTQKGNARDKPDTQMLLRQWKC